WIVSSPDVVGRFRRQEADRHGTQMARLQQAPQDLGVRVFLGGRELGGGNQARAVQADLAHAADGKGVAVVAIEQRWVVAVVRKVPPAGADDVAIAVDALVGGDKGGAARAIGFGGFLDLAVVARKALADDGGLALCHGVSLLPTRLGLGLALFAAMARTRLRAGLVRLAMTLAGMCEVTPSVARGRSLPVLVGMVPPKFLKKGQGVADKTLV